MVRRRLTALLLVLFTGLAARAAERYGNLYGRVLDTSEGGIADAEITAVSQETGFRRTAQSAVGGLYEIGSLQPGLYKLTIRKEGFHTLVRFNVPLSAAASTAIDFVLPVGSIEETVTVEGTPPPIEREDVSTGSSFQHEEIERLPLDGGGMLTLLQALPNTNVTPATRGEAGQFTAGGQRPNTNYFTVDGVSVNNGVTAGGLPAQSTAGTLPAVSAFGSLDSLITLESVEEFSVKTSSTGAEMGRMPGAQVAVVSQSGTNNFHAATAYRWRNEFLAANDWFANQAGLGRGTLRLNDVSQTLGGPVRRNQTFFFLAYQHLALDQPYVWNQPVPTAEARAMVAPWAQAALNVFPLPNGGALTPLLGSWAGSSVQPAELNAGSVRVDQAIGRRVSLFGRYNNSPSNNEFGSLTVNRIDLGFTSLTLVLTARPTANTVFESRVNESQSSAHSLWADAANSSTPSCALQSLSAEYLSPAPGCDYLVRFTIGGVGPVVAGREGDRRQRQFQTVNSLAYRLGGHSIEVGADYRTITAIREDATGTLGVIADNITELANRNDVWIGESAALDRRADLDELSLWVRDTWNLAARLTLSAGLRWEFSPAPDPAGTVYFLNYSLNDLQRGNGSPLWPTSYRDFAPRLGIAWRLTRDGKTVLRVGGGLYYDSSMSIAADFVNSGPWSVDNYVNGSSFFSSELYSGFLPNLHLPAVGQWNVSVDRALGPHDTVSVGYVGSAGYGLIRREVGGLGSTVNSPAALTTNNGHSNYQSFEAQYRRKMTAGLDALVSYTWSQSIDNDSSDAFLVWTGPGMGRFSDRGPSDFDLRHSWNGTLSYSLPRRPSNSVWARLASAWTISAIWRARTGFPITVLEAEQYDGIALINAFRPLLLPGQPLRIANSAAPGGWSLNPAAFEVMAPGVEGNLGRNALNGFGMWQMDLGLNRQWRVRERFSLDLFLEAFNAPNHPAFADPVRYLNSPAFGYSTSMLNMMLGTGSPGSGLSPVLGSGGPRTVQLGARFRF
jgi:hypothetical protein